MMCADLAKLNDATLLRAGFAFYQLTRCKQAYAREEANEKVPICLELSLLSW